MPEGARDGILFTTGVPVGPRKAWAPLYLAWSGLDGDGRVFLGAYLVLLPLYLAPLLAARYPPGLDLPFHLAMADMLAKQGRPDSPYAPFYEAAFGLRPYALHFWALVLLGKLMPLMAAHKLCAALYVAGLPLAAALLLGLCGRSRIPALLGFPLAYNLAFHYGYVSFAFALPVLLLMLAAVTRLLVVEDRPALSVAAAAALALALFLSHLQNFLFGVCAALAFIALSGAPWRRRLLALASLAPATAASLYWHFTARFADDALGQKRTLAFAWNAVKATRLADMEDRSVWADLVFHVGTLPVHLLRGFQDGSDVRAARALLLVLGAYVVLGLLASWARRREPAGPRPRLRAAAWVAFLGACAAFLLLPHHLPAFELTTLAPRFSVLMVLMGLLVVPAALRTFTGLGRAILLLPALALCGLYGANLVRLYRQYDRELAEFAAVLDRTPPGGRALGLVYDRGSRVMNVDFAMVGLPSLYPVLRRAPGSMTPLAFCGLRHMPCRRQRGASLPDPGPWLNGAVDPDAFVPFYDYFFVRRPAGEPVFGGQTSNVELIAASGSWRVYRRKGVSPAAARPGT
jgi:hypothetical protein